MALKFNTNVIKETINTICKILMFLNMLQVIPILVAIYYNEFNIAISFGIGMCLALMTCSIGYLFTNDYVKVKSNFGSGLVIASVTWIGAAIFSAISLYFCGSFNSFLDAFFDSISGFTTSGFSLIPDLDHLSNGENIWRHMTSFIGAQGIIVFALAFLIKKGSGIFKLYEAEGRDERIYPNTLHTAKFICKISLIYLLIGTTAFTIAGLNIGLQFDRALLHGVSLFMSSWAGCGFTPMSQNILYYHSYLFEILGMIFMILGCFNFMLQFTILSGKKKELINNIELTTFLTIILVLVLIISGSLILNNTYSSGGTYVRKVVYQVVSACTTSGFTNMYPAQFIRQWNGMTVLLLSTAMMMGGCIGSTAGGIKIFRLNIIFKNIINNIKKTTYTEGTIVSQKIHHISDVVLNDDMFKSASTVFISYITVFLIGVIVLTGYGYPVESAMFDISSTVANTGLTTGIVSPLMPDTLKILFIFIMWIARLEFVSAFALIAFIYKATKKKGVTKVEVED